MLSFHTHTHLREHVEADLAADGVREVQGSKALLQHVHELLPVVWYGSAFFFLNTAHYKWPSALHCIHKTALKVAAEHLSLPHTNQDTSLLITANDHNNSPDAVLQVVPLILVPLLLVAVASDGGHVDHAVAKFHEGTSLHGDV